VSAAERPDKAGLRLPPDLRVLGEGLLDHPECVCWCPLAQALYCGGEGGQIYRVELESGAVEQIAQVDGGFVCGVAVDGAGAVVACDVLGGRLWRIRPGDGEPEPYGEPIAYPNYPVLDAAGDLWVSDSGSYDGADGGIVRIGADGSAGRLAIPGLRFANGMALHDGVLHVIESQGPSVLRLDLAAGGPPEEVVVLPATVPDGLAFDVEGGLWISCYQPNRVYRLAPDGTLELIVDDWSGWHVAMPTNLAFAGPDLDMLVLANLGGRHLCAFRPGVRGAPLERPVLA
jgi:sugar lactone lactonase YvrE